MRKVVGMRDVVPLIAATVGLTVAVHAQEATPTPGTGETLLHPEAITITGHLEAVLGPTVGQRAAKSIGGQIDAKRATEVGSQLSFLWDLSIWRYLPADPGSTLNSPVGSQDDPFFTPTYLTVFGRQLEYQLKQSEKSNIDLFR